MSKLTKSQAGSLGGLKASETRQRIKVELVELYNQSPSICNACKTILSYNNRNNKYCSRSCAATFNNTLSKKRNKVIKPKCIDCGIINLTPRSKHNRCINCLTSYRFNLGLISDRPTLKKQIAKNNSYECNVCNVDSWNNLPIVLELDHIDGNASNNFPHNLRLLCPNCHSQTNTFKGRNRGNGRASRNLPTN